MDLFEQHRQTLIESEAPLAARMRPRSLEEFIGQEHILGPGRLLRRAIQIDQLASVIFYGPPGTGKTTLAQVIAQTTRAHFIAINAVLSGVKEIRAAVETAQERRGQLSQRTILFVDEVHRFNKAQQDALLPWVENGTIILIGATTENPYFEVNKALVSRSRIFQLKSLREEDLQRVIAQALLDPVRGYGQRQVELEPAALNHLVNVANGDARALLNALELAVETTPPAPDGRVVLTLAIAEESIQRRAVLYDKEGDAHFDTISALIKSLRGSDPDAALYWLARMIYAGEDPRFLFRRMLILASEDIGLADPQAVVVVNACAEAFDRLGLPEGHYPLAQAALYLAAAPKSNSVMGFFDALRAVQQQREGEVPNPLKDDSRDKHSFGHGADYKYPHAYREHWVAQQYLPSNLQGQLFYQPSDQGAEAAVQTRLARQREAQLAAMLEGMTATAPEILSYSPNDPAIERWLQRSLGNTSAHLATLREQVFQLAQLQRHHVVLDLNAGTGLLTWEALRQVPEGGVYARVNTSEEFATLQAQLRTLPELQRPIVFQSSWQEITSQLHTQEPELRFEVIVGRNVLVPELENPNRLKTISPLLQPQGRLVLAETLPKLGQRIYQLVAGTGLGAKLSKRWAKAEETIYQETTDLRLGLDTPMLKSIFSRAEFTATVNLETSTTQLLITPTLLQRWFKSGQATPSYGEHLLAHLSAAEVEKIYQLLDEKLREQIVPWQTVTALIVARPN